MTDILTVALAGNPNAGKTTLFNHLTGARQHVGNYPGITVSHKEGKFKFNQQTISLTDLPGTYSLTAYSVEELVARDYLVNNQPQVVINIIDASNLERNLYLACQFLELGLPIVIALNMIDVAEDRGITVDAEKLSLHLGVPVVPIIARSGKGTDRLLEEAIKKASEQKDRKPLDISYGEDLDESIIKLTSIIEKHNHLTNTYPARFIAVKYLENDDQILQKGKENNPKTAQSLEKISAEAANHLSKTLDMYPEAIVADHRYGYIKSIIRMGVLTHKFDTDRLYTTDKIDKVLTNRLLGPIFMLCVLFGLYQFTFTWSELPVAWLGYLFSGISDIASNLLPDGQLKSLVVSGIIDGVGGVLGFVPLIMFMFFGIAILEDSGYLARVAFMMDRVFRMFGLHGSSVMPFIVSGGIAGGCAVPGVMATRTLRSPKERMATLLTVPFMNCGAKIPVLALLIGTFFHEHQAAYMFGFTMLAWIVALIAAKILRTTVLRGDSTPFVMELPPYRFPTLRGLLIHTWERTWQYIKKAGTVILGISILLWAMMTYPSLPEEQKESFTEQRKQVESTITPETLNKIDDNQTLSPEESLLAEQLFLINAEENEQQLRNSIAGRIGGALEPISKLAGFDWRTNIALTGGIAAKEVIVSTLGTAYSIGQIDAEETDTLSKRLKHSENWNKVVAISVLVFIMFYAPCFVTVVCIAKESSWKWAAFSITFNTIFAFILSVSIYQIGMFLNLG